MLMSVLLAASCVVCSFLFDGAKVIRSELFHQSMITKSIIVFIGSLSYATIGQRPPYHFSIFRDLSYCGRPIDRMGKVH